MTTVFNNFSNNQVSKILADLIDAKNTLSNGLQHVNVAVSQERDPDVITAIAALFGNEYVKDGKATITFNMLSECVNVVRRAGKAKAKELIV